MHIMLEVRQRPLAGPLDACLLPILDLSLPDLPAIGRVLSLSYGAFLSPARVALDLGDPTV